MARPLRALRDASPQGAGRPARLRDRPSPLCPALRRSASPLLQKSRSSPRSDRRSPCRDARLPKRPAPEKKAAAPASGRIRQERERKGTGFSPLPDLCFRKKSRRGGKPLSRLAPFSEPGILPPQGPRLFSAGTVFKTQGVSHAYLSEPRGDKKRRFRRSRSRRHERPSRSCGLRTPKSP